MDTLTHLVDGALTPLAFPRAPKRAAMLAFGIAAGELPDIDIFFGATPEAHFAIHRGITHALVWQPVLALLVVLPAYLWMRSAASTPKPRPAPAGSPEPKNVPARIQRSLSPCPDCGIFGLGSLYLTALFALFTHIYLDSMTTFGTRIFLPFSNTRAAVPAMFIVDLILTLPALALMIYAWRLKADLLPVPAVFPACAGPKRGAPGAFVAAKARRIARIGLAWILIYPLAALGVNATATALYAPALAPGTSLQLLTEPFSPFVWKAVIEERRGYRMGTLFLGSADEPLWEHFAQPEPMLYETLKRQHPIFRQFEEFAPLMVQMQRPAPYLTQTDYAHTVTEYSFVDIRYIISPQSPARLIGRSDPNFILEARVNDSGALLAYRFLWRGAEESAPWTLLQ
jgi:inner membrane protein